MSYFVLRISRLPKIIQNWFLRFLEELKDLIKWLGPWTPLTYAKAKV